MNKYILPIGTAALLLCLFAIVAYANESAWGLTGLAKAEGEVPFTYVSGTIANGTMNDDTAPIGLRTICIKNDRIIGLKLPIGIGKDSVYGTISINGKLFDKKHKWKVEESMVYNDYDASKRLIAAMKKGDTITSTFTHGQRGVAKWNVTHSLVGFTEFNALFEKQCNGLK